MTNVRKAATLLAAIVFLFYSACALAELTCPTTEYMTGQSQSWRGQKCSLKFKDQTFNFIEDWSSQGASCLSIKDHYLSLEFIKAQIAKCYDGYVVRCYYKTDQEEFMFDSNEHTKINPIGSGWSGCALDVCSSSESGCICSSPDCKFDIT